MYKRQSLKHWVNYDKEQNISLAIFAFLRGDLKLF